MIVTDEVFLCDCCKSETNQLLFLEQFGLMIIGDKSVKRNFVCGDCKSINSEILWECKTCKKYTNQKIVSDIYDDLWEDYEQSLECLICHDLNNSTRWTDDENSEEIMKEDLDGGIYCKNCKCYKEQNVLRINLLENSDSNKIVFECGVCGSTNTYSMKKKFCGVLEK